MTRTIAVAGKGGVGKTTIAALLIHYLQRQAWQILAIDADPSSNLNQALGLPLTDTVGDAREEMLATTRAGKFPAGLAKQDYLEVKVQQALVETGRGLDLLAMGRPEGAGCYCAANHMLTRCIERLAKDYDFVVIDNEAGMEHISRLTTRDVDVLLIVTDPTVRGITAAGRIKTLVAEIGTRVNRIALILNRLRDVTLPPVLQESLANAGFEEPLAMIPDDPTIGLLDANGQPLIELSADSPVARSIPLIAEALGLVAHPANSLAFPPQS